MGGAHPCPAGGTKLFTDTMRAILVYLYESFRMAELAPDRDALEKRLFAAGFEESDINAALLRAIRGEVRTLADGVFLARMNWQTAKGLFCVAYFSLQAD